MAGNIPQTMRAVQWTAANGGLSKNLKVNSTAALPKQAHSLGPDQTLVKVAYTSLNPVDYKLPEAPIIGWLGITKPASPCLDFSGTVVASGRSDLKPGDRVFGALSPPGFGAVAEYLVVPNRNGVAPLPDNVPFEQAACVGIAGLTAFQSLASAKSGDKVFINGGSGGVGTFGIQLAKARGCYVVTACSGPNVDLCKSLGADEVIDYRSEDVVSTLKRGGRQFDLLFDAVGSRPELYWQCHHYVKPGAKYVTISLSPSFQDITNILMVFLIPSWLGGGQRPYQFLTCKVNAADLATVGVLMAEGKVKAVIDESFDLQSTGKAFEKIKTGRVRGKLAVKVSGEDS